MTATPTRFYNVEVLRTNTNTADNLLIYISWIELSSGQDLKRTHTDNANQCIAIQRVLRKYGYHTDPDNSTQDAIETIGRTHDQKITGRRLNILKKQYVKENLMWRRCITYRVIT